MLDRTIELGDLDIPRFLAIWELAFWPHPPPLLAHPLLSSAEDRGDEFEFLASERWEGSTVLAVETDYLPLTAVAMETSFFRWFGKYIADEVCRAVN